MNINSARIPNCGRLLFGKGMARSYETAPGVVHFWLFRTFIASSGASMTANVFTHPLETIKVRQVLENRSFVSAIQTIASDGGLPAFYNGFTQRWPEQ